jgi:hypothetical protein
MGQRRAGKGRGEQQRRKEEGADLIADLVYMAHTISYESEFV